jgi:two-component system, LytTR family, sensor kinase
MLTNGLLQVLVFYINAYWLFPVFYLNRRRCVYAAWLLALVVVYGVAHYLLMQVFEPEMPGPGFGFVFPLLLVLAASTAFALLKERIQSAEREKELTLRNLQGELAFLRSQMNPHFIFNVLNGMVSLARKRSDNLEPALLKLSGMIRYSLYDADVARVPVEKEISYLENYIELQQLRFGDEVIIKADIETPPEGIYISPMLLIPFVENAFKHGLSVSDAAISVSLRFNEGQLQLRVLNRFDPTAPVEQETGGIGLKNVKRRLELLYPGRYNLSITENIDFFVVHLKITADYEKDKMHSY